MCDIVFLAYRALPIVYPGFYVDKSFYFSFLTHHQSYSLRLNRRIATWVALIFLIMFISLIVSLKLLLSINLEQSKSLSSLVNNVQLLQVNNSKLWQNNLSLIEDVDQSNELFDAVESRIGLLEDMVSDTNIELAYNPDYFSRIELASLSYQHRLNMLSWLPNGKPLDYLRISSNYGRRLHPISLKNGKHRGIDLSARRGTAIYAPADGFVEYTRTNHNKGYGNMIRISHGIGFMTLYAHLKTLKVKTGQFVKKGQLIALSGNSGASTAPHLHYEIRFLNKSLDPRPFMNWNVGDFESIFHLVKDVPWDYLNLQLHNLRALPMPLLSPLELQLKEPSELKDTSISTEVSKEKFIPIAV